MATRLGIAVVSIAVICSIMLASRTCLFCAISSDTRQLRQSTAARVSINRRYAPDDPHAEPCGAAGPTREQRAMNNGLNPNIGGRDHLRALGLGAGAAFAVTAPLARAESASSAQAAFGVAIGQPAHSSYDPFLPGRRAG
jgi:hypothetical protein